MGSLFLENATIILSAILVSEGILGLSFTFLMLYLGGCLGDLFFYGLGVLASKWRWLTLKLKLGEKTSLQKSSLIQLFGMVFIARLVPGARTPAYSTFGFCRLPLLPFIFTGFTATLFWTGILFELSYHFYSWISLSPAIWRYIAILGFIFGLFLARATLKAVRKSSSK